MTKKEHLERIRTEIELSYKHLNNAFIEASLLWKQLYDDDDLKRRDDFSAYVSSPIGLLFNGMSVVAGALKRQAEELVGGRDKETEEDEQ